jgi:hypothetical protein
LRAPDGAGDVVSRKRKGGNTALSALLFGYCNIIWLYYDNRERMSYYLLKNLIEEGGIGV